MVYSGYIDAVGESTDVPGVDVSMANGHSGIDGTKLSVKTRDLDDKGTPASAKILNLSLGES